MTGIGLHIDIEERRSGGLARRTVLLRENGVRTTHKATYEYECSGAEPTNPPLDGPVIAFLFHAMQRGRPVYVHGPVTRTALLNLDALQGAWCCWRPDRYRRVDIHPETILDLDTPKRGRKAIGAYSGGVDSTFTALRHRLLLPPQRRIPLTTLLMVHGFDVALDNPDHFERLVERTQPFRDLVELDLRVVRTNSKELYLQDWQDSHAAELAACLHLYAHEFAFGLIGSTKSYNSLVIPYGTSPITDHLLSGDGFSIVHDGAEFSRTEKVAAIARHADAVQSLRVCWEGREQFRNCGVCEKCVRTRMNFAAVGAAAPSCFNGQLDPARIPGIPVRNEPQAVELRSIVDYAEKHGVQGEWLDALKRRVQAIRPEAKAARLVRTAASSARPTVGAALDAIGLKKPLKRMMSVLRARI